MRLSKALSVTPQRILSLILMILFPITSIPVFANQIEGYASDRAQPPLTWLAAVAMTDGSVTSPGNPPNLPAPGNSDAPPRKRFFRQLAEQRPLTFVPNLGQAGGASLFTAAGADFAVSLERDGIEIEARRPVQAQPPETELARTVISAGPKGIPGLTSVYEADSTQIRFIDANPSLTIAGEEPVAAKVNYILGNDPAKWKVNLPAYSRVKYSNLYPGVDLVYYGKRGQRLEYDLVVAPGADPGQIRFRIEGDQEAAIDEEGNLRVGGPSGRIVLQRPMLYQHVENGKKALAGSFVNAGDNVFAFNCAEYDHTRPLIIDPAFNLLYSTYLGGVHNDQAGGIALDANNNAYVIGYTASADFPVTGNAYQPKRKNIGYYIYNVVAFKFDPSGNLLYSTFLGGSGGSGGPLGSGDFGRGIAVDSAGNAYLFGVTNSTDFPVTVNAYQTTAGHSFLAELNPDGSHLLYSTYLNIWALNYNFADGGGIALNTEGQVVIVGTAVPGVPTTPGAYKTSLSTGMAVYAAILDITKTGSHQLAAATYYGTDTPVTNNSNTGNTVWSLAIDQGGNIWFTGQAYTPNLPTTTNAYQGSLPSLDPNCGGHTTLNSAAYLVELSSDLSKLKYATYISGQTSGTSGCSEWGWSVASDGEGDIYVSGGTSSTSFPVTQGGSQTTYPGGQYEGWAAKFSPGRFTSKSSAPVWSTYLGGNGGITFPHGLAVDTAGNAWVSGQTYGGNNFPITPDGYQQTHKGGDYNGFVTELSADSGSLIYSTYLGGSAFTDVYAIAVDAGTNLYLTGPTSSTDFPLTSNALQSTFANGVKGPDGNDIFFTILGAGTLGAISPAVGGNVGDVTITVNGAGFEQGATCELIQDNAKISSESSASKADGAGISCTFNLNAAVTGLYDVTVTNPSGGVTLTKKGGFTVQKGGQPNLSVNVIGRTFMRTGIPSTFFVNVANSGNLDALFVPVWITVPSNISYSFQGDLEQESAYLTGTSDGSTTYINLMIPLLTPGQTVSIPLQITALENSSEIPLTATVQYPWFATRDEMEAAFSADSYMARCVPSSVNSYALNCGGLYQNDTATNTRPFSSTLVQATHSSGLLRALSQGGDECDGPVPDSVFYEMGKSSGAQDAESYCAAIYSNNGAEVSDYYTPGDASSQAPYFQGYNSGWNVAMEKYCGVYTKANTGLLNVFSGAGNATGNGTSPPTCSSPPPGSASRASSKPASGGSRDPNYISGPTGDGSVKKYVRGNAPLTYSIGFENEATATLPAAAVVVTDQLDPAKVDLRTLSLGTIAIGSSIITPPSGTNNYSATFTPPGVTDYVVRIQGSLDTTTGLLKWTFQTIDPSTGLPPSDPTVGFLPPDTDGVKGQGSVVFSIMPKAGQKADAQIPNEATIVFDANSPISTSVWTNTLDVNPPTSRVSPLPGREKILNGQAVVTVKCSGTDVGSGIASFTIYVSDNDSAFTPLQTVQATLKGKKYAGSASYTGYPGHAYSFYSIATDGAGNKEAAKTKAETSTAVGSRAANLVETVVSTTATSVDVGGAFSVSDTVENLGDATSKATSVRYYLSTTTTKTSGSLPLKEARSLPALKMGAISSGTANLTVPSGAAAEN